MAKAKISVITSYKFQSEDEELSVGMDDGFLDFNDGELFISTEIAEELIKVLPKLLQSK